MSNKKEIAVVLSGCGVYDGAEIHESVLTLLAIARSGANYRVFAPDADQYHVVNHITGAEMPEKRNVLVEAARIARGNISPLSKLDVQSFDALIFPGGFGVAKNLSTFATQGVGFTIDNDVKQAINKFHVSGKPIGVMCIAPVLIPKILDGAEVTVGNDTGTINVIEKMNGRHKIASQGQVVIDHRNKIISTPCYMLDARIDEIADSTQKLVDKVIEMIG